MEGEISEVAQRLVDAVQQLLQQQHHSAVVPPTTVVQTLGAINPEPVQDLQTSPEVPTAAALDLSDAASLNNTEEYQVYCSSTAQFKTHIVTFNCCNTSCHVTACDAMLSRVIVLTNEQFQCCWAF